METIGFIGGGRITGIILHALRNSAIDFKRVLVFDTNPGVLNSLKLKFPEIIAIKRFWRNYFGPILFLLPCIPWQ